MAVNYNQFIYTKSGTPEMDKYNQLKAQLEKGHQDTINQLNKEQESELAKSKAAYDSTARQNYINYMQAQKRLPNELNSLGIRGGASESSLIRLGTNYNTNVASNNTARNTAADNIRNAYAKQIYEADTALKNRLDEAYATALDNQARYERESLEKDLQYFSGAIDGLYKSKDGYKNLIAQLKASNDPNKDYKIMLATRAMNALAGGSSGGGGGGGRGGYSRRGYGGGGSSKIDNSYAKDLANYGKSIVSGTGQAVWNNVRSRVVDKRRKTSTPNLNRTQQNSRWK